jgi:hypothetical protein
MQGHMNVKLNFVVYIILICYYTSQISVPWHNFDIMHVYIL